MNGTSSPIIVSPENPGLWIYAPEDWDLTPAAKFACRCGFVRSTTGRRQVIEFVANHERHYAVCPLRPDTP